LIADDSALMISLLRLGDSLSRCPLVRVESSIYARCWGLGDLWQQWSCTATCSPAYGVQPTGESAL